MKAKKTAENTEIKETPSPGKKYDISLTILGIIVFAVVFMFVIIAVSVHSKRNIERLLAKNNDTTMTGQAENGTEPEINPETNTETNTEAEANAASPETEGPAAEITSEVSGDLMVETPEEPPQEIKPSYLEYFSKDAQVRDTLVWDSDLRITATGIEYPKEEAEEELRLLLHFDNLTDRKLSLSSSGEGWCSINGYMVKYVDMVPDIPAGGSSDGSIEFYTSELELLGITHISRIQAELKALDSETNEEVAVIGPLNIETDSYTEEDFSQSFITRLNNMGNLWNSSYRANNSGEEVLAENEGVRAVSWAEVGSNNEAGSDRNLYLELENNSERVLYINTHEIIINGLMVSHDPLDQYLLAPGCRTAVRCSFSDMSPKVKDDLNELGKVSWSLYLEEKEKNLEPLAVLNAEFTVNAQAADISFGSELSNNDGIAVYSGGFKRSESSDSVEIVFCFYVKNGSDQDIIISNIYDGVVNDDQNCLAKASYASGLIPAGRTGYFSMNLFSALGAGPNEIKSLGTSVKIMDKDYNDIDEPALYAVY